MAKKAAKLTKEEKRAAKKATPASERLKAVYSVASSHKSAMYTLEAYLKDVSKEVPKFEVDDTDDEVRGSRFLLKIWGLVSKWNEKDLNSFYKDCTGKDNPGPGVNGKIGEVKRLIGEIFWAGNGSRQEAISLDAAKVWPGGFTTLKRTEQMANGKGFGGKKSDESKTTETSTAQEGTTMTTKITGSKTTTKLKTAGKPEKAAKPVKAAKPEKVKKGKPVKAAKPEKAAKGKSAAIGRSAISDDSKITLVGDVRDSGVKGDIGGEIGKGITFAALATKMASKHKMPSPKLRGYLNWMKRSDIIEIK